MENLLFAVAVSWMYYTDCCPTDFTEFPSSTRCFFFPNSPLDFVSAERACRSHGNSGRIAIIDTPELATWIMDTVINGTDTSYIWCGVNDLEENGVYRNNDGTMATMENAYDGVGKWSHNLLMSCLRSSVADNLQYWDTQCRYNHKYVCEMDAGDATLAAPSTFLANEYLAACPPPTTHFRPLKTLALDQAECASMCGRYAQCGAYFIHPDTEACILLKYHNYVYTFPNNTVLHQWILK